MERSPLLIGSLPCNVPETYGTRVLSSLPLAIGGSAAPLLQLRHYYRIEPV